jgi:transcriptional regulator with XRE-family HTH domain
MSEPEESPIPEVGLRQRLWLSLDYAHVKPGEMASELGVSTDTVANYVRGRTRPRLSTLKVWALRTGVPFAWLAHGTTPETAITTYKPTEDATVDTRRYRPFRHPIAA